jgi:hypothetical protein
MRDEEVGIQDEDLLIRDEHVLIWIEEVLTPSLHLLISREELLIFSFIHGERHDHVLA